MRVPVSRALTMLVVVGLCGYAVWRGQAILRVAAAIRQPISRPIPLRVAQAWIGVPAVSQAVLAAPRPGSARNRGAAIETRLKRVAALLAARPLSARGWLSLAGLRLVAGAPYPRVLAALRLSWLTGPNDGALLWQRGTFALVQWDLLPAAARAHTVRDLAGLLRDGLASSAQRRLTRRVLAAKPTPTRRRIARLLREDGVPPAALAGIGLPASGQRS